MKTREDFPHIKVGSEVKIRWDLNHGEWYGGDTFNENKMVKGRAIIVASVDDDSFTVLGDSNGFRYTWEMIDDTCLKTNPNTKVRFRFKLEQFDNLLVFQVLFIDPNICNDEKKKFTSSTGFAVRSSNNIMIGEYEIYVGGLVNKSGSCSRAFTDYEGASKAKNKIMNALVEWRNNNFFDGNPPVQSLNKNEYGEYEL